MLWFQVAVQWLHVLGGIFWFGRGELARKIPRIGYRRAATRWSSCWLMKTKSRAAAIPLPRLTEEQAALAGAKAASLAALARAGFPVPEGWVIPAGTQPDFDELVELIGDGAVAVRSSGIAEDLADASFAGMYETVLNVSGAKPLEDAFLRCLESAGGDRAVRYRGEKTGTNEARMGVLVQRMVAADAAGVAFSANPVTGDRGEILVSAIKGLGDRLVSGKVTPDEWVVGGATARCRNGGRGDHAGCRRVPSSSDMFAGGSGFKGGVTQ